jgi:hypothetical protein
MTTNEGAPKRDINDLRKELSRLKVAAEPHAYDGADVKFLQEQAKEALATFEATLTAEERTAIEKLEQGAVEEDMKEPLTQEVD